MTDPKTHEWNWQQLVEMAISQLPKKKGRHLAKEVEEAFGLGEQLAVELCKDVVWQCWRCDYYRDGRDDGQLFCTAASEHYFDCIKQKDPR